MAADAVRTRLQTIKTPDQRLRVFVSSTQRELAEERATATEAIRSLRLSPVLLDHDATSYASREIARSYLDQCQVFVAIYWQRYGSVPAGSDVSGLEDQLSHAGDLPKLIYLKEPAPDREPKLQGMLDTFRDAGSLSYRRFGTLEELRELIQNDLVVLLSERFEDGGAPPAVAGSGRKLLNLPSFVNQFVGRDEQVARLIALLDEGTRLITLTGPGGIGKSRLALEVGSVVTDRFEDGVHLVMLESLTDPELVLRTIAATLQVQDAGNPFGDPLVQYLKDKDLLLILDNFEQIVPAGPALVELLQQCPGVRALVTSRVVLNLSGEQEFGVPVLSVPQNGATDPDDLRRYAAVQLFEARALAVNPAFELTAANAPAVAAICKRLEGLPLALELAAARTRLFSPDALLARLDHRLNILTGGAQDLPERQRALRSTIAWSYDLLDEPHRAFFQEMAVFRGGWTLEAAEAVCSHDRSDGVLDAMQVLLDSSLIRQSDEKDEPRFSMLETVREFARELLDADPDASAVHHSHADYYLGLVGEAKVGLRTSQQAAWLGILETDHDNLRAALDWAIRSGRFEEVADAGWTLWLFWWVRSHLAEGRRWMQMLLDAGSEEMADLSRTRASAVLGVMAFWQGDFGESVPRLAACLEEFRAADDSTGIALSQLALGFMESSSMDVSEALPRFEEARARFEDAGDSWGLGLSLNAMCWIAVSTDMEDFPDVTFDEAVAITRSVGVMIDEGMALGNLGRRRLFRGDLELARSYMTDGIKMLSSNSVLSGTAYLVDAFAQLAFRTGDFERSARLFGGAEMIRRAINFPILPFARAGWERETGKLKAEIGDAAFERGWEAGLTMSVDEVVRLALAEEPFA